jgi:hypothetical protein
LCGFAKDFTNEPEVLEPEVWRERAGDFLSKTRDAWRKAMRIICVAKHQKNCKVIDNCNGNYCDMCHADGEKVELILEHKDNNKFNDDPDNIQQACHSCNQKKSPKHLKAKKNTGHGSERDHFDSTMAVDEGVRQRAIENNPQMAISEDLKAVYRSLLRQKVKRPEGCTLKEAIYGMAYELDISSVTTTRMLNVLTKSEFGPYQTKKKGIPQSNGTMKAMTFVEFRPDWAEAEKVLDSMPSKPPVTHSKTKEPEPEKPVEPVAAVPPITTMDIQAMLRELNALREQNAKLLGLPQPSKKDPSFIR